jgi:predicted PurR-regulated permease PerM
VFSDPTIGEIADDAPESGTLEHIPNMSEHWSSTAARLLQTAACTVVVAWGIRAASHLITVFLLALLLAYAALPFPKWIMRRSKLGKGSAIALTVTLVGTFYLVMCSYLVNAGYRIMAKLPVYQARLMTIYEKVAPFLVAHGVPASNLTIETLFSPERIIGVARAVIPIALGSLSNGALISLLSLLFVAQLSETPARQSRLVAALTYYSSDVQSFIAISAKTGALTAVVNLVLLIVVGVDFPLLWCVLYFFLQFIPNVGSILAVAPPALLALLMLGWKSALIVAAGMILSNILAANVLNPILLKERANISFLEIMLSLIVWGTLLGFWGGILAIPLTLVLKKFAETSAPEEQPATGAGRSSIGPSP